MSFGAYKKLAKCPIAARIDASRARHAGGSGVSSKWGYEPGSDMTGRVFAGWGIEGEVGFAVGRNGN
jgi:hypothetical protein